MKITATAIPRFAFTLTADQVRVLCWLSEHHYDGKCKSLCKVGGFLYGYRNSLGEDTHVADVTATWHEMDLMCKILECTMGLDETDTATARQMSKDFHEAIQKWRKGGGTYHWEMVS